MSKEFILLPHWMKTAESEFQMKWNYYIDLRQTSMALKLKFVKGRGYETYNTKEVREKKEQTEEAAAYEETEEDAPIQLEQSADLQL